MCAPFFNLILNIVSIYFPPVFFFVFFVVLFFFLITKSLASEKTANMNKPALYSINAGWNSNQPPDATSLDSTRLVHGSNCSARSLSVSSPHTLRGREKKSLLCRAGFVSLPFISPSLPAKYFFFFAHHRQRSHQAVTRWCPRWWPDVRAALLDVGSVYCCTAAEM